MIRIYSNPVFWMENLHYPVGDVIWEKMFAECRERYMDERSYLALGDWRFIYKINDVYHRQVSVLDDSGEIIIRLELESSSSSLEVYAISKDIAEEVATIYMIAS